MKNKVIIEVYGGVAYASYVGEDTEVCIIDYDHLERTPDSKQEELHSLVIAGELEEASRTYHVLAESEDQGLYDASPPADVQSLRGRGHWR